MNEEMKEVIRKNPRIAGAVLAALWLIWMLSAGCSRKVYVPVESSSMRIDTVYHTKRLIERDTVERIEKIVESRIDSIAPIFDSIGRMIGYDRWHIIDRSSSLEEKNAKLTATIDSLKACRRDSLMEKQTYPVEVIKEVNRLYWWQKGLMISGVGALLIIIITVVWKQKK